MKTFFMALNVVAFAFLCLMENQVFADQIETSSPFPLNQFSTIKCKPRPHNRPRRKHCSSPGHQGPPGESASSFDFISLTTDSNEQLFPGDQVPFILPAIDSFGTAVALVGEGEVGISQPGHYFIWYAVSLADSADVSTASNFIITQNSIPVALSEIYVNANNFTGNVIFLHITQNDINTSVSGQVIIRLENSGNDSVFLGNSGSSTSGALTIVKFLPDV